MNAAMRLLYRGGAWLPSFDAGVIAKCGLQHLRAYKALARMSVDMREPRFPIHCKAHMLNHTFRFLEVGAAQLEYIESPLSDSCQLDESFIGMVSRYSRRVSPRMTIQRTYDVYITSLRQRMLGDADSASDDEG